MDKEDRLNQQIALFYFAYKTFVETADSSLGSMALRGRIIAFYFL
ncbi:hypothetical protein PCORN_03218 [Listeria cornellensis FSL F6-0969]|uniref:Uncharacterized protein n=1 Tax=Listeria cornellensis FSL F6-0969 TaxID=1265820 RepID=W7C500_9LIST|nr:hypothetical protein [Listeria cornellensis]EUJ32172.1 hypothetical protein PCORN_03218 [Listeria cornellensis FSL F6-0969]